jgi:hypothetical protein
MRHTRFAAATAAILVTHIVFTVAQPRLSILAIYGYYYNTLGVIGLRQNSGSNGGIVQIPNARSSAVTVTLTSLRSGVLRVANSATIAANQTSVNFDYDGLALGRDTIVATAAGYLPHTVVIVVATPRLSGGGLPGSALTTSTPGSVSVRPFFASAISFSTGLRLFVISVSSLRISASDSAVLSVCTPACTPNSPGPRDSFTND